MMIEQSDSNSSSSPEASVQLLGDFLREKRTAKNFTLEKISQKTKINLNILRAIEAMIIKIFLVLPILKVLLQVIQKHLG